VDYRSIGSTTTGLANSKEEFGPAWVNAVALGIWFVAGSLAFLPFAFNTSPWDALTLRVPGNQGNWWHLLAGAPFFLAYPMIWLRLRVLFSAEPSTAIERRTIWGLVALSVTGTMLVEAPFFLHLAGTSEWQRLSILSLGLGVVATSAVLLVLRRRHISPTRACMAGLQTAYLANAALCLLVYAGAGGGAMSRSGWLVTIVIVWPISLGLIWIFYQSFQKQCSLANRLMQTRNP